jgi:hypothetical protein
MKNLASIATRIADAVLKKQMGLTSEMDDAVVDFLVSHPFPDDEDIHSFAEEKGYDTEQVEAVAYRLATFFAQFLKDGRANEKNFKREDADSKELQMGIKVEHEHSPNPLVAERISLDHLAENPESPLGYYTGLLLLEKFMESLSKMPKPEAEAKMARVKKALEE